MKGGKPLAELPSMGTVDVAQKYAPTKPCCSNLKELVEEYKQYRLLRRKDEMQANQESGTAAYIVSTAWVRKYHDFIMYDAFERGDTAETVEDTVGADDYFSRSHPGPMETKKDLCEADKD